MSIRDKIENHPILYVVGMCISAFGAGLGAYQGILGIAQLDVVPKSEIERLRSQQPARATVDLSELQQLRTSIAEKDAIANRLRSDIEALRIQLEQSDKGNENNQQISRTREENIKVLQDRLVLAESNLLQKDKSYSECVTKLEQAARASQRADTYTSPAPSNDLTTSPKNPSNSRRPYFDSNVLRVDVITFEESGPNYHLLLKHTNKGIQPLVIKAFKHQEDTFLHSDDGTQSNYVTIYQAGRRNELELSDLGRTVELAPGGSKVLSFSFARAGASKSSLFSYSSKYGYCINARAMQCLPHTPLFVSIKGLQLD